MDMERGSTFDQLFPDVRKEFEQMGKDFAEIEQKKNEAREQAINTVRDMVEIAEHDLESMAAIPWDLEQYAEQYRFSLAKLVERGHNFLNWLNRL